MKRRVTENKARVVTLPLPCSRTILTIGSPWMRGRLLPLADLPAFALWGPNRAAMTQPWGQQSNLAADWLRRAPRRQTLTRGGRAREQQAKVWHVLGAEGCSTVTSRGAAANS